jgi:hypothetical protein
MLKTGVTWWSGRHWWYAALDGVSRRGETEQEAIANLEEALNKAGRRIYLFNF